jgi:small-conductance mechanosensitive channel
MRRFSRHVLTCIRLVAVICALLAFPRWAFADGHEAPAVPAAAAVDGGATAPPSSSAGAATTTDVKIRDKVVFTFRVGRADKSPAVRAKESQAAIDVLLAHPEQLGDVRYEETANLAVIFVGKTPVITLGPEDAEVTGEALNVLAAQVQTRVADGVSAERKRSAIATTVFSVSLLVFSGLIAFWLLGRTSELAERLRTWMGENPERLAGIRLGKIEVISAGATRGGSSIALTLGHRLIQFVILYAWLLFGLSLFEATKGYTEKLTGFIVTPIYALASRVGSALPVAIIAAIAALAVSVLVRFVGLFFDSVARGDTRVAWLPRELARPTSTLLRSGIVVAALVLGSPLITGEADNALSRVGLVALLAIALSSLPLLASAAVGSVVLFGRRVKKGEVVEFGGRSGRVVDVRLFDVQLEDAAQSDISVPHLLSLFHPTRIHRHPPLASLDVVVDPAAPQSDVEQALLDAARAISSRGRVELIYLDAAGAHWRVHSASYRGDMTLGRSVQDALTKLNVGLGRKTGP